MRKNNKYKKCTKTLYFKFFQLTLKFINIKNARKCIILNSLENQQS